MRVLLVCDRFPFPLTNGQNLRIYHFVRNLCDRHSFDLVCPGEGKPPREIEPMFRKIDYFAPSSSTQPGGFLSRFTDSFRVDRMYPRTPEVERHLEGVLSRREHDVIWISGWNLRTSVPDSCDVPMLADMVDDGLLEHVRSLKACRGVDYLRKLKKIAMTYRFEKRYFCPADHGLLVSEVDADSFSRVCRQTPVSVVHNGVDTEFYRPGGQVPQETSLIFEGKIGFGPNSDGIIYFCSEILPLVASAVSDAKLYIVGKEPPPAVQALASERVVVTGYVDDVRPYHESAAVFVCPLRTGAGIKNKILQAWAMGKAVVATPQSAGGLRAEDGRNILIRDGAREFAEAVVKVLHDPALRSELGRNGRDTVTRYYTWRQKSKELEVVLEKTAAGGE